MSIRILTRVGAGLVALTAATVLTFAGATAASADTDERTLSLTRQDGSPIGTLFSDWTMVPGDVVSTTVVAHRTGGGVSTLLITLADPEAGSARASTAVENDVVITVASNGTEYSSSAAALMRGDAVFDLGRSSLASVPIDITFELPFSSGNDTQLQSLDLSLVVVATVIDPTVPPIGSGEEPAGPGDGVAFPNLPSTGASVRDALIAAAVVTCLGLLLLGARRRRDEEVDAD